MQLMKRRRRKRIQPRQQQLLLLYVRAGVLQVATLEGGSISDPAAASSRRATGCAATVTGGSDHRLPPGVAVVPEASDGSSS